MNHSRYTVGIPSLVSSAGAQVGGVGILGQTITYFCNTQHEPTYFPDRALAALLCVNVSTLRGRLNRFTKTHKGYRLLISEKAKTRLSSLHFIHWGQDNYLLQPDPKPAPLHGLVALNHVKLVNIALDEWISCLTLREGSERGREWGGRRFDLAYN